MQNETSLWSGVTGHRENLLRLTNAVSQAQVAHAYLFVGPRGVGKHHIATIFAAALNCDGYRPPCGTCPSCRTILRRTHQDTYFLEPEGNFITIDQVREVQRLIQLKNIEAKRKVVIFDDAGAMTLPAANSLLKTLEEPPGSVIFILIAASLESLPSTIISRCQTIPFGALKADEVEAYLADNFNLARETARLITGLSRGILADAIALASDDRSLERRRQILSSIARIKDAGPADLSDLAGALIDGVKSEIGQIKEGQEAEYSNLERQAADNAHLERMKKQLAKRHKRELARLERRAFNDILNSLNSYYRDALLMAASGKTELVANVDISADLLSSAGKIDIAHGLAAVSHIREARKKLLNNVNPVLALETLFYNLQEA